MREPGEPPPDPDAGTPDPLDPPVSAPPAAGTPAPDDRDGGTAAPHGDADSALADAPTGAGQPGTDADTDEPGGHPGGAEVPRGDEGTDETNDWRHAAPGPQTPASPDEGAAEPDEAGDPALPPLAGVDLAGDAVPTAPRAVPPFPRWIAVANQKGGVGKTTTAVNLGACLAELDYRVLIVDLDPQGNATTGLGLNPRELDASMYDVILNDVAIEDCVEPSSVRNLFVAPASLDLAGAEIELVPAFSRELRLRRALEAIADDYDFVLIDCPPSLGLLTINGLAAASEVLVPIQCEYYALEGLGQLLRNVGLVQRNLNPRLELGTIVLVMYDARTKLSDQVVREVRDHFGDTVCRIVIPRTVRLSEAPSYGQPIIAFDSTSRGAIAYRELAKEVSGGAPQRTR